MSTLTSSNIYTKELSSANLSNSVFASDLGKRYVFRRREVLPSEENSFWQINRGVVRVYTFDEDGNSVSLGFWGSGDFVGCFVSDITFYKVECLTDVNAIALKSIASCPASTVLAHIQQAEKFLEIIQQRTLKKRLMYFLIWLFNRFGQDTLDGKQLNLHLTHQEIAEAIGTTRVSITRLMQELQQEEFICWSKRNHLLLKS